MRGRLFTCSTLVSPKLKWCARGDIEARYQNAEDVARRATESGADKGPDNRGDRLRDTGRRPSEQHERLRAQGARGPQEGREELGGGREGRSQGPGSGRGRKGGGYRPHADTRYGTIAGIPRGRCASADEGEGSLLLPWRRDLLEVDSPSGLRRCDNAGPEGTGTEGEGALPSELWDAGPGGCAEGCFRGSVEQNPWHGEGHGLREGRHNRNYVQGGGRDRLVRRAGGPVRRGGQARKDCV